MPLILIDFINRASRKGMEINAAVLKSGQDRFRPILLTSVTTIAGLFPLLLERSFQSQFLIPMAVSISFGILASTILTLLYVPALYLIVRDREYDFSRIQKREKLFLLMQARNSKKADSKNYIPDNSIRKIAGASK